MGSRRSGSHTRSGHRFSPLGACSFNGASRNINGAAGGFIIRQRRKHRPRQGGAKVNARFSSGDRCALSGRLTPANVPEGFEASPHLSPEASNFDEDPSLPLTAEKIIESLPQKTSTIDFVVNLNQPLLSFEQPKPVSRRELIDLLEELLGAPIKYDVDQLGKSNLEKLVTINAMENTTVGSVITAVLHDAGWKFHLQPTHLQIQLHDNK